METTLQITNKFLIIEALKHIAQGQQVRLRAKGNSMLPFIRNDIDSLLLTQAPKELKCGMLLLALLPNDNYVIHRLIEKKNDRLILRGDGNDRGREEVLIIQILAMVVSVQRGKHSIMYGDLSWKMYYLLWPRFTRLRRLLLYLYKWQHRLRYKD